MLVLSRQKDETIVLGDPPLARVTVIDIRGDKVRLGIEAPDALKVHRDEVYRAIRAERGEAPPPPPAETGRLLAAATRLLELVRRAEELLCHLDDGRFERAEDRVWVDSLLHNLRDGIRVAGSAPIGEEARHA